MSRNYDTMSYDRREPDYETYEPALVDDEGGELDPREAASLLEQTQRRAQRQLDLRPPLLTLFGAAVILVVYGAVWLSVRDQHPYRGPSHAAIGVVYGVLALWIVAAVVVLGRAASGVGGRAARQRRAEIIAFATIWIVVYVFQGALHHDGVSNAVVYGVYAAAGPLVIVGAAAAAHAAACQNWPELGVALTGVVLAAIGAFAGPAGVWAVIAVGGCALLVAYAAVKLWQRRLRHA